MRYVSLQQLLQIKPLHAYWVIKTHNIMSQYPELIKRGFRKVGLSLLILYMLAGIEIYNKEFCKPSVQEKCNLLFHRGCKFIDEGYPRVPRTLSHHEF